MDAGIEVDVEAAVEGVVDVEGQEVVRVVVVAGLVGPNDSVKEDGSLHAVNHKFSATCHICYGHRFLRAFVRQFLVFVLLGRQYCNGDSEITFRHDAPVLFLQVPTCNRCSSGTPSHRSTILLFEIGRQRESQPFR